MDNKILYYLDKVDKILNGEFVAPVTCEIDPSNNCMLNCDFCMFANYLSESKKSEDLNLDYSLFKSLIKELRKLGTKSITFTGGGEPLMNPRINDMIVDSLEEKFELGLVTNGILLHKINNLDKFKFIRVSLDSYNSDMYKIVKGRDFFNHVIENIERTLEVNPTVGISYVINDFNNMELEKAEELADSLGVAYIQFKPAYINGGIFENYELPNKKPSIHTDRLVATDTIPCSIASLVGIIGANADVYFCCQMRGKKRYTVGNLKEDSFESIWRKRIEMTPDVSKCPMCRYMNYTRAYKAIKEKGTLFFEHKNFL